MKHERTALCMLYGFAIMAILLLARCGRPPAETLANTPVSQEHETRVIILVVPQTTHTEPQNEQKDKLIYLGEFTATAYCTDRCCNGKWAGITKMGTSLKPGYTVAVDPRIIPLGTNLYIEGIGYRTAEDTGGAIKGKKIDICMVDHEAALVFGKQKLKVWRIEE